MPTPSWGFGLNFTILGKPFLTTSNIGSPFIILIKTLLNSTRRRRERHRRSEFNSNSFRWWKRWDAKYGLWGNPKVVPTAKAIANPGLEGERRADAGWGSPGWGWCPGRDKPLPVTLPQAERGKHPGFSLSPNAQPVSPTYRNPPNNQQTWQPGNCRLQGLASHN